MFDSSTCWLVTAGQRARHAEDFVRSGVIAAGMALPELGDLDALPDPDIFTILQSAERRKPENDLRNLRLFTGRIGLDDIVVVPDSAADDIVLGQVNGPYAYREPAVAGSLRHVRPVSWIGRISTEEVEDLLVSHTVRPKNPVGKLPEQVRWLRLAEEMVEFRGRPATDIPSKARAVRKKAPSRPRTRKAAVPKPEVKLTPDRICADCGLMRAPSMFVGDDEYCRDCA